jgi:hypothetical protein
LRWPQSKFFLLLADSESLGSFFHDECRDTPISGRGICDGHGDANIGIVRVRDEAFGTVKCPLSIEDRARLRS